MFSAYEKRVRLTYLQPFVQERRGECRGTDECKEHAGVAGYISLRATQQCVTHVQYTASSEACLRSLTACRYIQAMHLT